MTSEQWRRVQEAFHEALEIDGAERAAYLDRLGPADDLVRRQVERLLHADSQASSVLDAAPGDLAAVVLPADELDEPYSPAQEPPSSRIGPYQIQREIGRGGMGAVYLAERADGQFTKQVALKLVKRGLDTDEILRRFRYEREILARLEHPRIARLLDGGATDDGRPYLVMEYVEGQRLDAWCDARRLSVEERLRLFVEVCETVQYAHQNLVIHRDLKPANILVTAEGDVKLLDFGIAKLVDEEVDGFSAMQTRTGVKVMTPEYASPEQMRGDAITTAADVFALGVLLYELLTGRRPFHRSERLAAAAGGDALLPRTPSSAVLHTRTGGDAPTSQTADALPFGRQRNLSPDRLQRRLRGDLDAIILKALRHDPAERYPTVEAMVDDLRRHLEGLPVVARRGSTTYRIRKFVHRHRASLAVAAAFFLLVTTFGVVHTMRLTQERNHVQRELAEKEAVTAFLVDLFGSATPGEARGDTLTAFDLLASGAQLIDTELADQPSVQGHLLHILSHVYELLGDYERSLAFAERSLQVRSAYFGTAHAAVAESENQLGTALQSVGDYDAAEAHLRNAYELRGRLLGSDAPEVAESALNLGLLLSYVGRYDEAEVLLQQALAIDRKRHGDLHADVATDLNNLALLHYYKGDYDAAGKALREALDIRQTVYGVPHPRVALTMNNLAAILRRTGALSESETLFQQALDMTREVHGTQHPDVPSTLSNLAAVMLDQGRAAESLPLLEEAVAIGRDVYGQNPFHADALSNLGRTLLALDRLDEAERAFEEGLQINRLTRGEEHPRTALSIYYLATVAQARGNRAVAEARFREALALQERVLPENHDEIAFTRRDLALLLLSGTNPALEPTSRTEAETLLLRAYEALVATYGPDDARVVELQRRVDSLRTPNSTVEVAGI